MATNSMASCNCVGKLPGCTCDGKCACACTCKKTYFTDDDGKDHPLFVEWDWMTEVDPNEGQEMHKTRGGKGIVAQAIARGKSRKLPPNCS